MVAIGCLLLVILPIVGFVVGGMVAGAQAAMWSAALGFSVAAAICGVAGYALVKAGRRA